MQNRSQTTPQKIPQKIRNILIRHSCSTRIEFDSGYQHPEADYLMKYSPKNYKSLALETKRQGSLLSKVKKIKKLKKFTGLLKAPFPQKLWLNLLANNKKEIEEVPQIIPINKDNNSPPQSLWRRLIKFFSHLKSLSLSSRLSGQSWTLKMLQEEYFDSIKDLFVRYVRKLRKLKDFEIPINRRNYKEAKSIIEKSDRMNIFFSRLKRLKICITGPKIEISDLFQNKQLFLHVADLHLHENFYPIFIEIIDSCKNLKSLSFNFSNLTDHEPEFISFLASIQHLPRLKNLESVWKHEIMHLWEHFKPQASLQYLKLKLEGQKDLFGNRKPEDFFRHWEELKELEELELDIFCWTAVDILLMRRFITTILKKTQKLRLLKLDIKMPDFPGNTVVYEPFFVKEVSHLYESLERFEHNLQLWSPGDLQRFDLEVMKPFRNLKELKLDGRYELYENIDHAVGLLQENQKEGEYAVLELKLSAKVEEKDWLINTLEEIGAVKRMDRNLKISMTLGFQKNDFEDFLEDLFSRMQSIKAMKGLTVCLQLFESADESYIYEEGIVKVLKKYPQQMRNLMMHFENAYESMEYIKIEGGKEQIFHDRSWL